MFDSGGAVFSVPKFHTTKGGIALQRQAMMINQLSFKNNSCVDYNLKKNKLEAVSKNTVQ